jgi:hypothetical protein
MFSLSMWPGYALQNCMLLAISWAWSAYAFFMGASVHWRSIGGGIEKPLKPFSARALGGGELDACRVFRGEGAPRKDAGGAKRVWESFDTSVTDAKDSR